MKELLQTEGVFLLKLPALGRYFAGWQNLKKYEGFKFAKNFDAFLIISMDLLLLERIEEYTYYWRSII